MLSEEEVSKKIEERKFDKQKKELKIALFASGNDPHVSYNKKNKKIMDAILDEITEDKYSDYIYYFAKYVKRAPIDKLSDAMIKTGDAKYMYYFARDIKGAPIDKLGDAIIKTKNPLFIYWFARDIKGAPIDKLCDAIIESQEAGYICDFALYVEGAPVGKLYTALNQLGDFDDCCILSQEFNFPFPPNYAIQILEKGKNKSEELKNLVEKVEKEKSKEALIKLRFYFDFLSNENSTLEDAIACDTEYSEYMKNCKKSKKLKRIIKSIK